MEGREEVEGRVEEKVEANTPFVKIVVLEQSWIGPEAEGSHRKKAEGYERRKSRMQRTVNSG